MSKQKQNFTDNWKKTQNELLVSVSILKSMDNFICNDFLYYLQDEFSNNAKTLNSIKYH